MMAPEILQQPTPNALQITFPSRTIVFLGNGVAGSCVPETTCPGGRRENTFGCHLPLSLPQTPKPLSVTRLGSMRES